MTSPTPDAKTLFGQALLIESPAQRAELLDAACGGDARLRAEVESLLRALGQAGDFLARPGAVTGETGLYEPRQSGPPGGPAPGGRVGPYKLLQQIGEGGMGAVFMADQEHPVRRRVAIKVVKPGMDSAQVVARFEAERQALALMDHPNIARVLDGGLTDAGRPYFAMELVHGVPITKYCDDNRLTPRERLELFVPVCQAIQHAHTKGIIHRDVKPSNILVTLYDGKPVPKVIDFGIAKATEQRLTDLTMFTQYGAAVGTFEYMSPEQAEVSGLGVDARSDVYSLGVVLYELLTGTTPLEKEKLQQAGLTEKLRMIKEDEPPRPSTQLSRSDTLPKVAAARKTDPAKLSGLMKGELDWVVMKCLEKDRTRRYETANALARDLQRYLADEPVEACPPSAAYRLRRLARKYRGAVLSAAAFVLLLIVGVVVSFWLAVEARRQRDAALANQKGLRTALTERVAERIEADLWRLEMVGQGMAGLVADNPDWGKKQLEAWMQDMLARDDRIFGLCLASEPRQLDPQEDYYALYVYRKKDRITGKESITPELLKPEYDYHKRAWYRDGKRGAHWTEPYFDDGGANLWIVSYAMPLRRRGQEAVVGVLTVDVSVGYFERLRGWLTDPSFGKGSGGLVVSGRGVIISHSSDEHDLWKRYDRNEKQAGPGSRTAEQRRQEDPLNAKDVPRRREREIEATVGRAGWTFIAVVGE